MYFSIIKNDKTMKNATINNLGVKEITLTKEQKETELNYYVAQLETRGIKIVLPTVTGINVMVINDNQKYCTLCYHSDMGFYISTAGSWYPSEAATEYASKLTKLSVIAETLNSLYEPKN